MSTYEHIQPLLYVGIIAGFADSEYFIGMISDSIAGGPVLDSSGSTEQQGMHIGHCKYTFRELLFLQVCSDTTPLPHHFWQNAIAPCSTLLCKEAASRLVLLQIHLQRFGRLTSVQ